MKRILIPTLACSWLGMAPAPAVAAPALEIYGNLPQVELLRLTPSGERVAMIGVVGDKRQLVVVQLAGNKLLKAAGVGSNKIRDLGWAGDDHVLVFVTSTTPTRSDLVGRYELGSVLHVGLDGPPPWSVFDKSDNIEHVVRGYFGTTAKDEHWSAYFGGISLVRQRGFSDTGFLREHTYSDLYRVDLETGQPQLIAHGGRGHYWLMGADGEVAAHTEYQGSSGEWVLYAGAERSREVLRKPAPLFDIELSGLGRRPGTVLVTEQTDKRDVAEEIDLANGHTEALFSDSSTSGYLFDPTTKLLIGARTVEEPGALLFDPAMQKHYNATRNAFPNQQMRLASYSPNLKEMIVLTEGNADAGTFWLVSGETHRADPIGFPYPQIKADDVGPIKMISFRAADGLAMEGILTLPPGRDPKDLPLVVFPHGGPIDERDNLGFDWWAQAVASRGYAVFQPNYRGSGGYSAAFREAGQGEWGRKLLSDIADGVSELAKQQIIDPKRVCIMGASYGGYAALAGVTVQQGLYRCAVSVAGVADMPGFSRYLIERNGLDSPAMRYWFKLTGSQSSDSPQLYDISPIKYASRADAPILLIHGKDDTRVPIGQSTRMAAALRDAGKKFEYVVLQKEDHFLSRDATRLQMLTATVNFIEKYNPAQR